MSNDEYKIRRIIGEEAVKGSLGLKGSSIKYLVDWEPSLLDARSVSKDARECYKFSVVVKGPCQIDTDDESTSKFTDRDWLILKVAKADPKNVTALRLDYQRLRKEYPQELIQYYEDNTYV